MKPYLICDAPQRSPEWFAARAGKATGSRAAAICAKGKGGAEAVTRRDYRFQLAVERLTGLPCEDGYVSKEMQWGTEQEPFARMAYEAHTGEIVQETGFLYLPNAPAGCSVDGLIGQDGFQEIKCPKTATHLTWLLEGRLPPDHVPQTTHNFYITGAEFMDFVSFDPRVPEQLRLFVVRVMRNEMKAELAAHETELHRFLGEVDALEAQLRARTQVLAKAA
jgi:hypothetical protein